MTDDEINAMIATLPFKVKARVLRSVAIPDDVVRDLNEVKRWIEEGGEVVEEPSDDLIQINTLCGGLMDDESGRFYFSVHLPINRPYVWDIALSPAEISAIATGVQDSIMLWCCQDEICGAKT